MVRWSSNKLLISLTWTNVATVRPKVKAICMMCDSVVDKLIIDPHPIITNNSVPKNSATNIFHIALLSVISDMPKMLPAFVSGKNRKSFFHFQNYSTKS